MLIKKCVTQKEGNIKYNFSFSGLQLPNLHFREKLNNRNNDQEKPVLETTR